MSSDISKRRRPLRCNGGTASLEFGLVAVPFFFLLIAGTDLGRFLFTEQNLRTAISEAARAGVVSSADNISNDCSTIKASVAPTSGSAVPFLDPTRLTLCVTKATVAGVTTISVTGTYPFSFNLPLWTGRYANGITETTSLQY